MALVKTRHVASPRHIAGYSHPIGGLETDCVKLRGDHPGWSPLNFTPASFSLLEKSLQNDKLHRRKLKLNKRRRIGMALNRHTSLFPVEEFHHTTLLMKRVFY